MKSMRIAALLLLVPCLALTACKRGKADSDTPEAKEAEEKASLITVEVAPIARGPITASYTGTASLEADREAQVVAKASGILLKLHAEEGMQVKTGQVLAELDPERPRLQLAQAKANLNRLENDFRRSNEMFAKKLLSSEQFEKIKYELDTQKAAYELAKVDLDYTRILAPIDGVLSQRMVKEGNLIQLHQTLFRIDDFDPLLAVLNVPERELNTLRPGLLASMEVDSLPGQKFDGAVARVAPVVDPKTGTFRVTCEFRDASAKLKSGMFGRLDIVFDRREDVLTLPRAALIEEDGQFSAFVVTREKVTEGVDPGAKKDDKKAKPADPKARVYDADVAHKRAIKIGYIAGERVEVREGLAEGERVVTVGRSALREGTKVQILEAKP